jgi:hypothetical protein
VVVRVDAILRNDGVVTVTDVAGKDITVELAKAGSVKAGERAVFYTNVDVYGDGLAVAEVGHEPVQPQGLDPMRAQMSEMAVKMADEKLQQRVKQAELIVVGRVTAAHPYPGAENRVPGSEHAPEWWEATVKVQSVEKGQAPGAEITVMFPHSKDLRWFASPKFKEGQEGIFLLHRTEDKQLRVSGYTALHALDYQSMDQSQRIRKLAESSR